jgi:6,7-dimethyl-8-ribityllumazine synthase
MTGALGDTGEVKAEEGCRIAIAAARFNADIVDRLLTGAVDGLVRHGVGKEAIAMVRCPGSWELPLVCQKLAASGKYDAVIALGAVIRGDTAHFDHVASGCANGLARVALDAKIPVVFGVLTCDTFDQAAARAGGKAGNKGFDAAVTAIEMVNLLGKI